MERSSSAAFLQGVNLFNGLVTTGVRPRRSDYRLGGSYAEAHSNPGGALAWLMRLWKLHSWELAGFPIPGDMLQHMKDKGAYVQWPTLNLLPSTAQLQN